MGWFRDFYENDYYRYYFEPKLDKVPVEEVDFIVRHGQLDFSARRRPRVFDICCGIGRHARPLARAGCEVIGVDLSGSNINAAKALADKNGLNGHCVFHQDDIRRFDPPRRCDLAINIFTSFGYFATDEEDAIIVAKAAQSLRLGGRFILDIANREAIIGGFKRREVRGRRGNYVIEECSLDLTTGKALGTWTFVRGKTRSRHQVSIRLYALHELIRMANACGLRFVAAYGSFAGLPYGRKSPRCIFIAEKPKP